MLSLIGDKISMDKIIKDFYEKYFSADFFGTEDFNQRLKNSVVRSMLMEGKHLYKFYGFDHRANLNRQKIETLKNEEIWCSPYYRFSDKSEFEIKFCGNPFVGETFSGLEFLESVRRTSNLASFTYEYSNYMWETYANRGNGFCVEYEILDTDSFYPVLYDKKDDYDFTVDIIETLRVLRSAASIEDLNNYHYQRLAILPLVLKDRKLYKDEKEIRFLDRNESVPLDKGFLGQGISLKKCGLKARAIIVDFEQCVYREELFQIAKENQYGLRLRC